jgi:hypothetical protein
MRHGLSIAARFKAVVLVIAALFTLAGAEPARGLAAPAAFGFWMLSVGAGLGLAVAAAAGLARWPAMRRRPRWQSIGLAGVIGLLLYTPLSLGLEGAFGVIAAPEPDDDWLDRLEASGGWSTLVAEVVQAGPLYLVTWALLNVAPAAVIAAPGGPGALSGPVGGDRQAAPVAGLGDRVGADDGKPEAAFTDRAAFVDADTPVDVGPEAGGPAPEPPAAEPAKLAEPVTAQVAPAPALPVTAAEALGWPPALGDEVLSVRADLHYLHVSTVLGRATVLGTLAAVEAHFGEAGLRIHRSHWVARRAIRRVASGANGWRCELHDGQRLPISRRRVAEVRALLGRDFVLESS